MKNFWKRSLAFALAFLMVFGLLPVTGWKGSLVKKAFAAEGDPFTEEEFRKCYAKTLLSMVGRGYGAPGSASGYYVNGTYYSDPSSRVTAGTPYSPTTINGNTNDCYGMVITALMAMGYDYFYDDKGHTYPLNANYGGGIFDPHTSSNAMFRYNGTGDIIHLHHSNNAKYNANFKIGNLVNKASYGTNTAVAGDLLFSLKKDAGNPTGSGPFSAGAIKEIDHAAVALFYMGKPDSFPQGAEYANNHRSDAKTVLHNSYDRARQRLIDLFGFDMETQKGKGSVRPNASNWTPFLWDARGRGFGSASATEWREGFADTTNPHFNTPYNSVWQIEAITNTGVSVNNNPYGKDMYSLAVELKPTHPEGEIVINKTEDGTGTKLSGAQFTLYEWSKSANAWKVSANYKIAENGTSGTYYTYNMSNARDAVEITEDNMGQVRVVETKAPHGFSNIDTGTGQPYAWEHTFPTDVFVTQSYTIDAVNKGVPVGFTVYKHLEGDTSTAVNGAVFRLYSNDGCTTLVNDATGVSSFTTNTSGKFNLKFDLKSAAQTFYFKEYTAPSGYALNTDTFRISIAGAATGTITVDRRPAGGSSWTNVATVSYENAIALTNGQVNVVDAPLSGNILLKKNLDRLLPEARTFWFMVKGPVSGNDHFPAKTYWKSVTVPADSTSAQELLSDLPIGNYTIAEVTGDGSTTAVTTTDAFPFTASGTGSVTVTGGETATATWTNEVVPTYFKITKKLSQASQVNRTFWFRITDPFGAKSWTSVTITAGNTEATTANITCAVPGTYLIAEVTADGSDAELTPSEAMPYEATGTASVVTKPSEVPVAEWMNTLKVGKLKLSKSIDKALEEDTTFWFLVQGPTGGESADHWVSLIITAGDLTAETVIENLPIGVYTVKEVDGDGSSAAPVLGETFPWNATGDETVTVVADSTVSAAWTNEYRKGTLSLVKTDGAGPLAGVEFTIYDESACATELAKLTTGVDGKASSGEFLIPLSGRKVYVKETKTDKEHVLIDTVYEVELVPNGNAAVNGGNPIVNTRIYGRIGVKKTGETFVGYTETTTEYGPVKTPKYATGSLAGAKFLVFKADDVTVSGTDVTYNVSDAVATLTSTDSEVFTDDLPLGKYVVVEDEAPSGYVKVPYVGTVELKKKDEVTTIVVEHLTHENKQADTSVVVYKEAEVFVTTKSGERVSTTVQLQPGEGFIFGVFAEQDFAGADGTIEKGALVLLGTTGVDGRIDFSTKLPLGKYSVKELKTKDGYYIDENSYPFTLEAVGHETQIRVYPNGEDGSVVNRLRTKKVQISKKALMDDTPLPGTQIQVYDEEGHVIFDQLTDEDGNIPEFYALIGRTYTFREVYAPSGYAIFAEVLSFTVKEDGTIDGTTVVKDDVAKVELLKTDEGGHPLKGVEFTIYDLEELPVQVVMSDENGIVRFEQLAYGDYIIKETKPLEGMQLSEFRLDVHVDGTWENAEPVPVINLPEEKTGERSNMTLFILIIAMIGALFALAAIYDRRQRERSEATLLESACQVLSNRQE